MDYEMNQTMQPKNESKSIICEVCSATVACGDACGHWAKDGEVTTVTITLGYPELKVIKERFSPVELMGLSCTAGLKTDMIPILQKQEVSSCMICGDEFGLIENDFSEFGSLSDLFSSVIGDSHLHVALNAMPNAFAGLPAKSVVFLWGVKKGIVAQAVCLEKMSLAVAEKK